MFLLLLRMLPTAVEAEEVVAAREAEEEAAIAVVAVTAAADIAVLPAAEAGPGAEVTVPMATQADPTIA